MFLPIPQYSPVFITITKYYSLISGTVIPYTLFFYIKIPLTILGSVPSHINLRISIPYIKTKQNKINLAGILLAIALNL